jgi:hypothetical protein
VILHTLRYSHVVLSCACVIRVAHCLLQCTCVCAGMPIAVDQVLQVLAVKAGESDVPDSHEPIMTHEPVSDLDSVYPGAEAFFAWADKDGDGYISFEEAQAVIDFLGPDELHKFNDRESQQYMWGRFVGEGDEFGAGCDPALGPNREQFKIGLEAFKHRCSQDLTFGPFKLLWARIMDEVGAGPCPPGMLDTIKLGADWMFGWADKDGDGRISFDEAFAVIDFVGEELVLESGGHAKIFSQEWRSQMWGPLPTEGIDRLQCRTMLEMALGELSGTKHEPAFNAIWARVMEEMPPDTARAPQGSTPSVESSAEHMARLVQMDVGVLKRKLLLEAALPKSDVAGFISELTHAAWRWPDSLPRQRQFRDPPGTQKPLNLALFSSDEESVEDSAPELDTSTCPPGVASTCSEQMLALQQEVESMRAHFMSQGITIPPGSWGSPERLLMWRVHSIGILIENHPTPACNGMYRNIDAAIDSANASAPQGGTAALESLSTERATQGSVEASVEAPDPHALAVIRAQQAIGGIEGEAQRITEEGRQLLEMIGGDVDMVRSSFHQELESELGTTWTQLMTSATEGTSSVAEFVQHMRTHGWQMSPELHVFLLLPFRTMGTEFWSDMKKHIGTRLLTRSGSYQSADVIKKFVLKLSHMVSLEMPPGVVPPMTRDDILGVVTLLASLQEHDRRLVENIPAFGFHGSSREGGADSDSSDEEGEDFGDDERVVARVRLILAGARLYTKSSIEEHLDSLSSLAGVGLDEAEQNCLRDLLKIQSAPDSLQRADNTDQAARGLTLQNAAGMYCYRHHDSWVLNSEQTIDSNRCHSYLGNPHGGNSSLAELSLDRDELDERLDALKPGAAAFFKWADKDGDGHISFGEACDVLDFLGRDLVGKRAGGDSMLFDDREKMWSLHITDMQVWDASCDPALGPSREQFLGLAEAIKEEHWAPEGRHVPAFDAAWARITEELQQQPQMALRAEAEIQAAKGQHGVQQQQSAAADDHSESALTGVHSGMTASSSLGWEACSCQVTVPVSFCTRVAASPASAMFGFLADTEPFMYPWHLLKCSSVCAHRARWRKRRYLKNVFAMQMMLP